MNLNTTWLDKIYTDGISKKRFLIPVFLVGTFLACIPKQSNGVYPYLTSFVGEGVYRAAGIATCMWCILNYGFVLKILEVKPIV